MVCGISADRLVNAEPESESPRRLSFSAHLATICVVRCGVRVLCPPGASAANRSCDPTSGQDSLALCPKGRFGLTTWFGSDPERNLLRKRLATPRATYAYVERLHDSMNFKEFFGFGH